MTRSTDGLTRVVPPTGIARLDAGELWRYRELLGFLVWRNVVVRYKQTILGVLWVILQPLLMMLVLTLFLGRLVRVPGGAAPYPLFVLCGIVIWQLFSVSVAEASNSLVANERLITKVYFPRLLIPIAAVMAVLIDFAISLVLLLTVLVIAGYEISVRFLWLIPITGFCLIAASAVGFVLSTLNVRYRDVRHTIGFVLQLWLFATPVVYPMTLVPESWRTVYGLNPMGVVVDGFRWVLIGTPLPDLTMALVSASVTIVLFVAGAFFFRWNETTFADIV